MRLWPYLPIPALFFSFSSFDLRFLIDPNSPVYIYIYIARGIKTLKNQQTQRIYIAHMLILFLSVLSAVVKALGWERAVSASLICILGSVLRRRNKQTAIYFYVYPLFVIRLLNKCCCFFFLFFFRCGLLVLLLRPFSTFWYYTNTTFNRNIMRRKEEEKKGTGGGSWWPATFFIGSFLFSVLAIQLWDYGTMGRRPQVPDQFNFMHILLFFSLLLLFLLLWFPDAYLVWMMTMMSPLPSSPHHFAGCGPATTDEIDIPPQAR